MYTRVFERKSNEIETINLSEYYFEWYVGNTLTRQGLVDPEIGIDGTAALLEEEGFKEVL